MIYNDKLKRAALMMVYGLYESVTIIDGNELTKDIIRRYKIYGKLYKETDIIIFRLDD